MQKLDILGVGLADCSLRESISMVETFVKNGALNTVLFITTSMLVRAGESQEEKARIEQMDLTIFGDADILRVAGLDSKIRMYETENQLFLKEFLRRLGQGCYTIYLLSDSQEDIDVLTRQLKALQQGISIIGSRIVEEEASVEDMVNEINDIVPAVIISRMSAGKQEKFMLEAKPYINAEIWIGLPEDMQLGHTKQSIQKKAAKTIYKKIFHRRYQKYQSENEE